MCARVCAGISSTGTCARAEPPGRVFVDAIVDAGNALAILLRSHDLGAELLLQRKIAAGVVEMMMRVEDVA